MSETEVLVTVTVVAETGEEVGLMATGHRVLWFLNDELGYLGGAQGCDVDLLVTPELADYLKNRGATRG